MTIKHIQDQIENFAFQVASDAFRFGLQEAQKIYNGKEALNKDDTKDELERIIKNQLKGEN